MQKYVPIKYCRAPLSMLKATPRGYLVQDQVKRQEAVIALLVYVPLRAGVNAGKYGRGMEAGE